MSTSRKMLIVFLDETDKYGDLPAYEAIVRKLLQMEIVGASVLTGMMGFGRHHLVHRKRLLGVADDRPVTILAIDEEEKLRGVIPSVRRIVPDAMVALIDAEVQP